MQAMIFYNNFLGSTMLNPTNISGTKLMFNLPVQIENNALWFVVNPELFVIIVQSCNHGFASCIWNHVCAHLL